MLTLELCNDVYEGRLGLRAAKNRLAGKRPQSKGGRNYKPTGRPRGVVPSEHPTVRQIRLSRYLREYQVLCTKDCLTLEEGDRKRVLSDIIGEARPHQRIRRDPDALYRESREVIPQDVSQAYDARMHPVTPDYDIIVRFDNTDRLDFVSIGARVLEPRLPDGRHLSFTRQPDHHPLPSFVSPPVDRQPRGRDDGELSEATGELTPQRLWGGLPVVYPIADEQVARSDNNLLRLVAQKILTPLEAQRISAKAYN